MADNESAVTAGTVSATDLTFRRYKDDDDAHNIWNEQFGSLHLAYNLI